jgi:hypothetical protein
LNAGELASSDKTSEGWTITVYECFSMRPRKMRHRHGCLGWRLESLVGYSGRLAGGLPAAITIVMHVSPDHKSLWLTF